METVSGTNNMLGWCFLNPTAEVLNSLYSGLTGGHLGEEKTLKRLHKRFYWPGHTKDVHKLCQQCLQCAQRKIPGPRNEANLASIHAGYPLQLVAMKHCVATVRKPSQELVYPNG